MMIIPSQACEHTYLKEAVYFDGFIQNLLFCLKKIQSQN